MSTGDTLQNILADFQHSAEGSQCEKPLFHVQFRHDDGETLTREQWLEGINRLEERLELTGHERVIVTHRLNGQDHVHVAWNRMNPETGKAAELHYYKHKCTDVARELEREFGLRELSNDRKRANCRMTRNGRRYATARARRRSRKNCGHAGNWPTTARASPPSSMIAAMLWRRATGATS